MGQIQDLFLNPPSREHLLFSFHFSFLQQALQFPASCLCLLNPPRMVILISEGAQLLSVFKAADFQFVLLDLLLKSDAVVHFSAFELTLVVLSQLLYLALKRGNGPFVALLLNTQFAL